MTRRHLIAAAVVAALGAAVYSLSPLAVALVLVLAGIVFRGVRDLRGRERLLVGGLLVVASVLRLVAVAGVFVTTNPWLEPFQAIFGDARYTIERSLWVRHAVLGEEIGPYYRLLVFNTYGGNVFYYYLAYLQVLLGAAPYAITLVSVVAFVGGSVMLHRRARQAYGVVPAGIGLALLLFWPTWFVWSVSMLKESVLLLLSATAIVCVARLPNVTGWPRAGAVLGAAAGLGVLATLRDGALVLSGGGILFGVSARAVTRRAATLVVAFALVAAAAAVASRVPAVRARMAREVEASIDRHVGHWRSVGISYRIADDRFYTDGSAALPSMTWVEGARFLARAVVAFVVVPLPWHVDSAAGALYLPQHFLWLILLAFGMAGAWIGLRRDLLLTAMLVGYGLAAVAVIAPNSGNVGTLIRHRDTVVPFLVWLSGVGIEAGLAGIRHWPAWTASRGAVAATAKG